MSVSIFWNIRDMSFRVLCCCAPQGKFSVMEKPDSFLSILTDNNVIASAHPSLGRRVEISLLPCSMYGLPHTARSVHAAVAGECLQHRVCWGGSNDPALGYFYCSGAAADPPLATLQQEPSNTRAGHHWGQLGPCVPPADAPISTSAPPPLDPGIFLKLK